MDDLKRNIKSQKMINEYMFNDFVNSKLQERIQFEKYY